MRDTPDPHKPGAPIETIIAFDFGQKRIGVAVGQSITGSASPIGVVANTQDGPDHDRIAELIKEWQPQRLVVGIPLTADGEPGEMAVPIRAFIDQLRRYGLPITTIDERYTSLEAQAGLKSARQAGSRGRIRKEHVDAAAAVLIAERYLKNRCE